MRILCLGVNEEVCDLVVEMGFDFLRSDLSEIDVNLWQLVRCCDGVLIGDEVGEMNLGVVLGIGFVMDMKVGVLRKVNVELLKEFNNVKCVDGMGEIREWLGVFESRDGWGKYIVFEGMNSCGKGTQLDLLRDKLKDDDVWFCREPGTTWIGNELRRLLQEQKMEDPVVRAEVEMLMAQRSQLVMAEILPRLKQGVDVISDRSEVTSLVFQGVARGEGVIRVGALNGYAVYGLRPDLVVYLRAEKSVLDMRDKDGDGKDRFELEGDDELVRLDQLSGSNRWRVVDAGGTVEDVEEKVWSIVANGLEK